MSIYLIIFNTQKTYLLGFVVNFNKQINILRHSLIYILT